MNEIFDIIKLPHIITGHGSGDKMVKVLSKYANVTREMCLYLCVLNVRKNGKELLQNLLN